MKLGQRLRPVALALIVPLLLLAFWHVATHPTLVPPIYFDDPNKAAFFFGEPLKVAERIRRSIESHHFLAREGFTALNMRGGYWPYAGRGFAVER